MGPNHIGIRRSGSTKMNSCQVDGLVFIIWISDCTGESHKENLCQNIEEYSSEEECLSFPPQAEVAAHKTPAESREGTDQMKESSLSASVR